MRPHALFLAGRLAAPCLALLSAWALTLPSRPLAAQQLVDLSADPESIHSTGLWNGLYTKYRIDERLFYHGEYHVRTREAFVTQLSQLYLRFGLTWRAHDSLELTGGLVTPLYWAPSNRTGPIDRVVPQFRFWEQALFSQVLGRVRLYHQFRFEQRWARDFAVDSPWNLTYRWRYKVAAYIPLNDTRMVEGTFFLAPSQEIFMQSGRTITFNHFEDNRVTLGAGYIISPNLQVQVGYMWTYRHAGSPMRYEHRHLPRISLYHNTDFASIAQWFSSSASSEDP